MPPYGAGEVPLYRGGHGDPELGSGRLFAENVAVRLILESDNEDDSNDSDDELSGPASSLANRIARRTLFKNMLVNDQAKILKSDEESRVKEPDEHVESVQQLLAKERSNRDIISDPREYQLELFGLAKQENIITVLDTGSGKTLIAVLLLRHVLDQEVEHRANGKPPRIAVFLVNTTTLVFQQYGVLKNNLSYKVSQHCGQMKNDLWNPHAWPKILSNSMVVVCTAEILNQALFHSFVTMDQINLLIFDEAHHAKAGSAFAKIIKDYYKHASHPRPRIFGMTASPVDSKYVDTRAAIKELEQTLHAKVVTIPLAEKYQSHAKEERIRYQMLPKPFETQFYRKLWANYKNLKDLAYFFKKSKYLTPTLGSWAADMYWKMAVRESQFMKIEAKIEQRHVAQRTNSRAIQKIQDPHHLSLEEELKLFREAADMISKELIPAPTFDSILMLSTKVASLHLILSNHFELPTEHRCIVFVNERVDAKLLCQIFSRIGTEHLRPGVLTGAGSGKGGEGSMSFRDQVRTLNHFRGGKINCLFSTSVAEEGLDIPDCNLVVRWDLYNSMIGYIQSKGRARQKNSKFIDMMEMGNSQQEILHADVRAQAERMRQWCTLAPESQLVRTYDFDWKSDEVENTREFVHWSTQARLNYDNSLVILAHFASTLPLIDNIPPPPPQYIIAPAGGFFQCEVIMPANAPVRTWIGPPELRKSLAKRACAFDMCIELLKRYWLTDNLLPNFEKELPKMRNAQLALDSKKANKYEMRTKPLEWDDLGNVPTEVYVNIFDVDELDRPHQPLGILTRRPLPSIPDFPMFLNSGKTVSARVMVSRREFTVTMDELNSCMEFSRVWFHDLFNKLYEAMQDQDHTQMAYWVVPVRQSYMEISINNPYDCVDWEVVRLVGSRSEIKWTPETPYEYMKNKLLIDKWDGGRRFFSIGVDPTKKPLDEVPREAAPGRYRKNILDYSVSLFKKSRLLAESDWDRNQPVLLAEKIRFRRNMLSQPHAKELTGRTKAWLCPEPLKISTISVEIAAMSYVFPAMLHRVEDYMIALNACEILGIPGIPASLALEAVTKDSDNSGEHDEVKINLRSGMGNNYERLEFIGDTFLKLATTISLYATKPNFDEFNCHVDRMMCINNRNLFNAAKKFDLAKHVRTAEFSRRTWYPSWLKLLEGKGKSRGQELITHRLGDKSIADVCEALIGAAYCAYDKGEWKPEKWDAAVHVVTMLVQSETHVFHKYHEYHDQYKMPDFQKAEHGVPVWVLEMAKTLEAKLTYHFKYPTLLQVALNHPSNSTLGTNIRIPSYQRLEFLGDALFDMICVSHLFYRHQQADPQWLTEHKMAMVSNKFLGALCVKIGLHTHLRALDNTIIAQIAEYAGEVTEAEEEAKGGMDYWTDVKTPPKCLPDIVEAYLGAMFVDSGFDFTVVQAFFDEHVKPFFVDMSIYDTFASQHPTTFIHTLLIQNFGCREYSLLSESIPNFDPLDKPRIAAGLVVHDKVIATAVAGSGRYAKMKASLKAKDFLEGLAPYEFRERTGCKCKLVKEKPNVGDSGRARDGQDVGDGITEQEAMRELLKENTGV